MSQIVRVEKFAPVRIGGENRGDRVVYQSRNSKDKTSFVAYSSPNSPHAEQLAQIALAVQSDNSEKRRAPARGFLSAPISYFQRQIGIATEPVAEQPRRLLTTTAETYQEPQKVYRYAVVAESEDEWSSTEHDSHSTRGEVVRSVASSVPDPQPHAYHYSTRNVDYDPPTTAASVVTTVHHRSPSTRSVTYIQQPQVTRLDDEERISYTVRGANGKLYVSAPAGSAEAQLFDDVARAGSEPKKERRSHERRLVADRRRHHRDRSRRSSQ